MSGTMQRTVMLVCVLALISMGGLISMLVTDVVILDRAFLLLAALPPLYGLRSVLRARAARRATTSIEQE